MQIKLFLDSLPNDKAKQQEVSNLQESLKLFRIQISFNNEFLSLIQSQVNNYKKELKRWIRFRVEFYYGLLHDGKYVRNEGISVIIRKLRDFGEPVDAFQLPEYLDSLSKEYILRKTELVVKLLDQETILQANQEIYTKSCKNGFQSFEIPLNDSYEDQLTFQNISKSSFASKTNNKSNQHTSSYISQTNSDEYIKMHKETLMILNNPYQFSASPQNYYAINNLIFNSKANQAKSNSNNKNTFNEQAQIEARDKISSFLRQQNQSLNNGYQKIKEEKSLEETKNETLNQEKITPPHLLLYEDTELLTKYNGKEQFLRNYDEIQDEIEKQKLEIVQLDKIEAKRIIYEYDFRSYEKIYNMDCSIVLTAIIGAKNAQSEMIRNAMKKK